MEELFTHDTNYTINGEVGQHTQMTEKERQKRLALQRAMELFSMLTEEEKDMVISLLP